MLMEASHSNVARKFHVSEAVQDAIVQISGVVEAFQGTSAQNTHDVEIL
jgi:hypothetical protein